VLKGHDAITNTIVAHGVGFVIKTVEMGAVEPRVLHHFELARDVGIEANEVKTARITRLRLPFGVCGLPLAIYPTAPDDTVHF